MKLGRRTIFLIILTLFLLGNMGNLYYIDKKITTNNIHRKNLSNLLLLDKEIDLIFKRKMSYLSYDNTNINLANFNKILNNIKRDRELKSFFEDDEAHQSFVLLENKFKEKSRFARQYSVNNTFYASLLRQLIKIFEDVKVDSFREQLEQIELIHLMILQTNLGENVGVDEVSSLMVKLKKSKKGDSKDSIYNYLTKAELAIEYMKKTSKVFIKNEEIALGKQILEFSDKLEQYSKEIINRLYFSLFLSLLTILLLGFLVFYFLDKMRRSEQELSKFRQAVQNSDNSIVMTNVEHKIVYINTAFEKTTGYGAKEAIGQSPAILQSGLHDRAFYDEIKMKLKSGNVWSGEFSNRRKDGKLLYEKATIFPIFNAQRKLDGYLAIKLDITSEKSYLQEIEAKNMEILVRYQIDEETGLWSKNVLIDELSRGVSGYVIYLKISEFADMRFFYGTSTANLIMQKAAQMLKRFVSIYKLEAQPFRVGEDDFCILYKRKRPSLDLFAAIDDYFVSHPIEVDGTIHTIRLVMGVSTDKDLPQGDRLLQGMIAFYKARKQDLLYVYYVANNELEKEYRQNILITQKIRYALDNNLVNVHCQGIFDTKTQDIFSYEILMRLKDKDGNIMYPGEFLDVAKHSSLYTPLMFRVISLAFELLHSYPKLKFSINMSVIDMLDKKTVNLFVKCLELCKYPQNLIVEILESEGIENYDGIKPFLSEVRSFGCKLSIDDFGSGYSNYYRIMQLDIDHIKIDGSIIKELPRDKNSRIVVETILEFAKRKGWGVVAEFVSDEDIFKMVADYGIDFIQGYYLAKPKELEIKPH